MITLRKSPKTPQGDPDGDNFKRAHWARMAVLRFQQATRTEDGDAVSDLLCDLMHMCDYAKGEVEQFEAALQRARDHYVAETSEDGEPKDIAERNVDVTINGVPARLTILYCPVCGEAREEKLLDEGTVFVEDGPYNGKGYVNEGDWARYRCDACGFVFGPMPEPIQCAKCGCRICCGELGEDCDEYEGHKGWYLCEDCMKKGQP